MTFLSLGAEEREELRNCQRLHDLIALSLRSLFLNTLTRHWSAVPSANKVRLALPGQGWAGDHCCYLHHLLAKRMWQQAFRHHSCLPAPWEALFPEELENRETQKGIRSCFGRCNLTRRTMGNPNIKQTDSRRHLHTEPHFVPGSILSFLDN